MGRKKRKDPWQEQVHNLQEVLESQRQSFVRNAAVRREGIAADREKFILDLGTGSPKVLPPNKE
ncbi:MAG: hypothetical protein PWQ91_564 [Eubacteriales bacterium]|nr:hypothetical protein [Eubacteriales bacterium]MDN5363503.1 hypothetical protein [Eubacteriales bacterium]